MAVNETRDMVTEMQIGATEGGFKSLSPDRGGEINAETVIQRSTLNHGVNGYGIETSPVGGRPLPNGRWAKQTSARGGAAPR